MKSSPSSPFKVTGAVAPVRERGLKLHNVLDNQKPYHVAPARERGLKFKVLICSVMALKVAPVRERGLKCVRVLRSSNPKPSRSRKGAWIEMALLPNR